MNDHADPSVRPHPLAAGEDCFTRREFLGGALAFLVSWCLPAGGAAGASVPRMHTRPIPDTGESLPIVGLGTWQQFDVRLTDRTRSRLREVLSTLYRSGGSVVDTSPMYGRAESVLGDLLRGLGTRGETFLATKVWTRGRRDGIRQMEASLEALGTSRVDLMQIHNLVDWRAHVPTLRRWKRRGRIRYWGITHYTVRALPDLAGVIRAEQPDFVQCAYSIDVRQAEETLLPLTYSNGVAVLVNRPFAGGSLFARIGDRPLPPFTSDWGCRSWAQLLLKYVLGHEAVTCVIPGTSDPEHMLQNARAGAGALPDTAQRRQLARWWDRNVP